MSLIGHNRGPALAAAGGWHRHCWTQARADLLPVLPVEVVRLRVRRAAELGLDYRTYAGVRATTGRDLVAFLFSSNALRLLAPVPALGAAERAKLEAMRNCGRIALARAPLEARDLMAAAAPVLDGAHPAPAAFAGDRSIRERLRAALGPLACETVLLVGDTQDERDWCAAARLAGYLPADRFFAA